MARNVDRPARRRLAPASRATVRALAMAALLGAGASAGDGDLPDLSPPGEAPAVVSRPATAPPSDPPTARPTANPTRARATLALPGLMTAPPARPSIPLEGPRSTLDPLPTGPALEAPLEMRPPVESSPVDRVRPPSRPARPLDLEPSPIEDPAPPVGPGKRPSASTGRPGPPARAVQAPTRRPRFFGLLPASPGPAPAPSRASNPGRSAVVDDLGDDSAAEAALKKRIERQAREVVGNRARSVEVKLSGKDAVVSVLGVKFLQKRAVRKQLEGLPALSGLRSTIDVVD